MDNLLLFLATLAVAGVGVAAFGLGCWLIVKVVKAVTGE